MFSNKLAISAIVALVIILASSLTHAWWGTGHLTVGAIAKMNLDQFTIDVINAHFDYLSKFGSFPSVPEMIQACSFPDDIKPFKVSWMDSFHFTNYRYKMPGDFSWPTDVCPLSSANLISTYPQFVKAAMDVENEQSRPWVTSFALGYILHLAGDSAQPLHSAELYNASYPNGDQGGNLIHVTCPGKCVGAVTNLHSVWDSLCCTECSTVSRPYNASYMESSILSRARRINATYNNIPYEDGLTLDPVVWSQEAYLLAIQHAYPGVANNSVISSDYINQCIPVAERQMCLAGMRLATQLRTIVNTWYPLGAANRTVPDFTKMFAKYYPEQSNNKMSGGDIAGVFIGGMITSLVLYFIVLYLYRKSGSQNSNGEGRAVLNRGHTQQDYGITSSPSSTPNVNYDSRQQKF